MEYEQLAARASDPAMRSSLLMMAKRWRDSVVQIEPPKDERRGRLDYAGPRARD